MPPGYRLLAWHPDRLADHAEAKFLSFRHEIDADVFSCLGDSDGCFKLMEEISDTRRISARSNLAGRMYNGDGTNDRVLRHDPGRPRFAPPGWHPKHRHHAATSAPRAGFRAIFAALAGFQQVGLPRAYLEVTAQNEPAVRLYRNLGFVRTKTLYKTVEFAYT